MGNISLPLLIMALLFVAGIVVLIFALRKGKQPDLLEERLAEFATLERPLSLEEIEMSQPFSERVLLPVLKKVAELVSRLTPKSMTEGLQHKLDLAGNPYGWGPMEFMAIRVVSTILLSGVGVALLLLGKVTLMQRILLMVIFPGLGFYLPSLLLMQMTKRRQKAVIRALPDALDLLTICVEAGLGFDAALAKVTEKWENELSLAFKRVLQEVQLGKLRREALREMAARLEVPDVSTFVAAIIQADQLGVSIARVLRIQSDQMRLRRRQRAEELARASTLKILIPVVFLIFPAILIVLLGPGVITMKNLGGVLSF